MKRLVFWLEYSRRDRCWVVRISKWKRSRRLRLHCAKRRAVQIAAGWARLNQPSQLKVRRLNGTIEFERTYPRSSDPRRHRG